MHFNNSEKCLCLEVHAMINQHIELNIIFSVQIKISFYFLSELGNSANTWWFFKKINACSLGYIIFLVFITYNDNSSFSFVILVICTFSFFSTGIARGLSILLHFQNNECSIVNPLNCIFVFYFMNLCFHTYCILSPTSLSLLCCYFTYFLYWTLVLLVCSLSYPPS